MKGSPRISTSALGMLSVMGRSRVARPPARMATGSINASRLRHYGRAVKIEAHPHLAQSCLAHGPAQPGLVFGVEHQEAAAAGADQLAAQRSVAHGQLIIFVDRRVR